MIRLHSSSRCSRQLMAGMGSGSESGEGNSAVSGILALSDRLRLVRFNGVRFSIGNGFWWCSGSGYCAGWWLGRKKNLMIFDVKVRDLRFNLSLEFIRGPLKFVERLADLTSNLG